MEGWWGERTELWCVWGSEDLRLLQAVVAERTALLSFYCCFLLDPGTAEPSNGVRAEFWLGKYMLPLKVAGYGVTHARPSIQSSLYLN